MKMSNVSPAQRKYDYMLENNKNYMNYTALSFGNRKITYEEMHESIEKYAKLLYKKGVRRGDLIGLCCLNTPESVYLLYALDIIGAIVVGFSPLENVEKTKKDIEMIKPKMVITVDMMYRGFKEMEKALNFSTILYSPLESIDDLKLKLGYRLMQLSKGNFKLDKNAQLRKLLKQDLSKIEIERAGYTKEELTDILFTGGSTGVHKGVDLAGEGLNHVVKGTEGLFFARPGMIELGHIPFGHMCYGRMILHYALCNNMEYALTLKAMPNDFYDELVRTGAEGAVGGPPHWVSLIEKTPEGFRVSSKIKPGSLKNIEYATSGGEANKKNTIDIINEALEYGGSSAKLGDGLGATETWSVITVNNGKTDSKGTIGHKINCADIKIVDPNTGAIVPKGEAGILYVSGPTTMLRYHNNVSETNKVISYDETGKKWINLGDIIKELPNGEYEYVGRQKRNFVSGVENIYPEELEDLLIKIPEIREVVVTPISDEIRQYYPKYHISLYNENVDTKLLEEKINKLVLSNLSESWLPGDIEYYYEPLKRMLNTKIDINYYKEIDKKKEQSLTLK